jgi:hypothetical protein
MNTSTYVCGACTTGSIANLGAHKNAEEAMREFCRLVLGLGNSSKYGGSTPAEPDTYWVFTAGPEVPGHGHSKSWVRYGTEFAQYIIDHKLGDITTLAPRLNKKYHPTTTCQTWLWAPDKDALSAWYHVLTAPKVEPKAPEVVVKAPEPKVPPVEPKKRVVGKKVRRGEWTTAMGIAGGQYQCPHCQKTYDRGEKVFYSYIDWQWYCEDYGKGA